MCLGLAAALLGVLGGSATAAAAVVALGTTPEPTTVAAAHGVVAWSTFADGRYWLTASIDGTTARLPVASRGVPFDVDVGDVSGEPAITYSRCQSEPVARVPPLPRWSDGRRCRPWAYLTASGREIRLATGVRWPRRASVALPSAAGATVAFVLSAHRQPARLFRVDADRRLRRMSVTRVGRTDETGGVVTEVDVDAAGRVAAIWDLIYGPHCPPVGRDVYAAKVAEVHLMTTSSDRRLARTCATTGPRGLTGLTWDGATVSFADAGGDRLRRLAADGRSLAPRALPAATFSAAVDGPATFTVVSHPGGYDVLALG
jgi:hypothetical protein